MPALQPFDVAQERRTGSLLQKILAVPPNFFSIAFGLTGLAAVWRLFSTFYGLPATLGNILYVLSALVLVLLLAVFVVKFVYKPARVIADLAHPVLGPFNVLFPLTAMLLVSGLAPYAPAVARVLFIIFLVATLLLAGWMTGSWMMRNRDLDKFHSGYFLPTVAGGLLGADGAARFGLPALSWMSFGVGVVGWLLIGSLIMNRHLFRPRLPAPLIPTLAIEIAPVVLAGNAYFTMTNGRIDLLTYMLAGYAVLMALVQLRLLPLYLKTPFSAGFWAFTFPFAATAIYALRWLHVEHFAGAALLSYGVLIAISLLVAGVALRSLVALQRGAFVCPLQLA